jgi:peptidoglycan hydrolase CwlO-like protein
VKLPKLKIKTMKKIRSNIASFSRLNGAILALVSLLLVAGSCLPGLRSLVLADQFDDQIRALQNQNASTQSVVDGLQAQASSYQDAINKLQQQINGLQASIDANVAKQADLQNQIVQAQQEIDRQRAILASDVTAMYVDGTPSALEMLATSKNLSDFVDKQEYRSAVQNKLQDTMNQIAALQAQLKTQKEQVEQLLATQKQQQTQLAAAQAEQSSLLAYNEGQQAAYNQQIQSNQQQISNLRAQQLAANRALGGSVVAGDPGHGGYPSRWDAPVYQDSLVDSWGMYNRECVSYTAWKVYQTYGYMPYWGGVGNANQWPGDAQAAGIPTGYTPKVHSVAISMHGAYGHAMWVEAVSGNMIYVSQYNYDLQGHYSEMWVNGSNFIYLYFGS